MAPVTHMGEPAEAPGSGFQPNPALTWANLGGELVDESYLSLSLSITLTK